MKNPIQRMYSIWNAKWYDPFKKGWNFLIAGKAEKYFSDFLKHNLSNSKSILELGCGTALNLQKISKLNLKFKKYIGVDFTESMLEIAKNKFRDKNNIEFKKGDITELKSINEKFDIIICTWVISHLKNPVDFVNKTQKYLKSKGKFFLIFYTKPKWYLNFWFKPIAKYFFYADSFDHSIIKKFYNVKHYKRFTSDLVSVVEISLPADHMLHQSHDQK